MAKSPPRQIGRPKRSDADVAQTRKEIAAVALRLFHAEGCNSVSIRRLAQEAGCSPMTIYAHFDGKIGILQYLWADVLDQLFEQIEAEIASLTSEVARLSAAAQTFLRFWIEAPEHFRLVFMSDGVERSDVGCFLNRAETKAQFQRFAELVAAAVPAGADATQRFDSLLAALIGAAMAHNTLTDYPWIAADKMADDYVDLAIRP
jgi:AcrR family transcriptional regulator